MNLPTADQLISGIDALIDPLMALLCVCAIVIGMLFIVEGFAQAYKMSKNDRAVTMTGVVTTFFIGGLLLSLSTLFTDIAGTVAGSTTNTYTSLAYAPTGQGASNTTLQAGIKVAFRLVALWGAYGIVRALILWKRLSQGSPHVNPDSPWIHFIGGALAANCVAVLKLAQSSFNFTLIS